MPNQDKRLVSLKADLFNNQQLQDNALALRIFEEIRYRVPATTCTCEDKRPFFGGYCAFYDRGEKGWCGLFDLERKFAVKKCRKFFSQEGEDAETNK